MVDTQHMVWKGFENQPTTLYFVLHTNMRTMLCIMIDSRVWPRSLVIRLFIFGVIRSTLGMHLALKHNTGR